MKIINKITISLAVASSIFFVGCNNTTKPAKTAVVKPTISEESLGLRKTNLYVEDSDTVGAKATYGTSYAGSGYKIKRAFQDAPPMIPHDVDGMLPITIKNNACIGCHAPAVAKSMGATPYPISHMTNFRPTTAIAKDGNLEKDGKEIKNTSSETLANVSIEHENKLVGARYNCTQCHAPQSTGKLAVKNTFTPDFTSKDGASRSSWNGSKFMEGIDTTK